MAWTTVLEKVVLMQSSRQLCVVKDLSAHEMVMRLMRKENYLIGMLNKGGFAAVLIIIAFLEKSLLEGHIFGRNLLWYAAVFGTITAISQAAIVNELLVLDPEGAMSMVVQHTHYMPKRWRGKESTEVVRIEFETLFQYTGMMLLEEMASIFLTPYLLLLVVPKRVDDILQFISDFTVDVEGVAHVCSFSVFEEKLQAKLEEKFQLFAKAVLDPSNSRLNVEALAAMFTTPPDATSAPCSSTSTHAPEAHRENDEGDEGLDGMDDEEFEDIC